MGRKAKGRRYNAGCIFRKVSQNNQPEIPPIKAVTSDPISGILKKGIFQKDEIIVSNLTEEGSKRSQEKLGVVTTLDNRQVVKNAKTIILAVKPQFAVGAKRPVKRADHPGKQAGFSTTGRPHQGYGLHRLHGKIDLVQQRLTGQ